MKTSGITTTNESKSYLGILTFVLAVVGALSVTMVGFTSFTAFNPPDWLRILTMAPLLFMVILAVLFGIASLIKGQSRDWAIAGLVIAAFSVIAFGIMVSRGDEVRFC